MLNLEAALRGAVSASIEEIKGSRAPAVKLDADAVLARLALTARLYAQPCPFSLGDLVTPRADGKVRGAGEPHVVTEVLDGSDCSAPLPGMPGEPISWSPPIVLRDPRTKAEETCSPQFGQVLDMRVARFVGPGVAAYVVESQDFEAWTPEHDAAWRAKLAAAAAAPQPLTLTEAISALRDRAAGKEVKAEWKEGDTVEIVPEPPGAEPPMNVEGIHVGVVRKVDQSDGTTHVTYHAASTGKIGNAWLQNSDLRKWGPKPVETTESASA